MGDAGMGAIRIGGGGGSRTPVRSSSPNEQLQAYSGINLAGQVLPNGTPTGQSVKDLAPDHRTESGSQPLLSDAGPRTEEAEPGAARCLTLRQRELTDCQQLCFSRLFNEACGDLGLLSDGESTPSKPGRPLFLEYLPPKQLYNDKHSHAKQGSVPEEREYPVPVELVDVSLTDCSVGCVVGQPVPGAAAEIRLGYVI